MAVYYAQSSANINASNIWNTAANGSGTYLTWPPASGDVLMANNKTITVNVDCNLGSTGQVRNDNANGATAGGYFDYTDGVTITANAYSGSTSNPCVRFNVAASGVGYFVGKTTGSAAYYALAVVNTGTLNITGDCGGGSGYDGVFHNSTGSVNITGVCYGSSSNNAYGARNNLSGTINLTGDAYGGSGTNSHGINNVSTGTITINGNLFGGSGDNACGANNASSGTITHSGNASANDTSQSAVGLANGAVSTGYCSTSGNLYAGANGNIPIKGNVRISASSVLYLKTEALADNAFVPVSAAESGAPSPADVRHGTSYALGTLTGTCYVPAASSVVAGVPVDATVGTADLLTAADVRSAIGLASANLDAQLADLPTAAENATAVWGAETRALTESSGGGATAEDVWTYATRSLTEAPDVPTVEEIAAEVRTELTPELGRMANCATVESTGDQLAGLL